MRRGRRRSASHNHHQAHPVPHGADHLPHPHHRRRRGRKRRAAVKGLLIGAMVLHAQPRPKAMQKMKESLPVAEVKVSMDSFTAIPPYLAYDNLIEEAAKANGLDPDLIHAVIEIESAFNPLAVSKVGAQGLMQLMPVVQAELGVDDPFDPRQNIFAGAKYLKRLLDYHDGNIELTLASYNAGLGNVARYKGIPPFKETRNYVKKIKGLMNEIANAD